MISVDAQNVAEYLRSSRRIGCHAKIRAQVLSGGVSNIVLRIETDDGAPFVIKQACERLRTEAPWFSRLDRVWRETAMMRAVAPLLPAGTVPRILFEDREQYLFAMEAVDSGHVVWKQELLAGRVQPSVAACLGAYLATIHRRTCRNENFEREFGDREVFVQLRVDPFYRHVASVHAELRPRIDALIDEMWQTRTCLVHADFSPKNVLIVDVPSHDGVAPPSPPLRDPRVTLIDFETGHYGDPAFDLGFFLSHLLLKGVRRGVNVDAFLGLAQTFWQSYVSHIDSRDSDSSQVRLVAGDPAFDLKNLERRTVANLAGCALARVDGTSPVDYLTEPNQRDVVRRLCRCLFCEPIDQLAATFSLLESEIRGPTS